ncbi:ubiquinol oxidase 2, mitochondrial [Selaginella moellendorffii]|uniref:ubiquinol oxidase 2, mitochondrial n=1 Tax=Selaginella moellendorffii TaxID=88036 RepID=UPI000D1C369C|nr:ubiquinol oxidase 2, mitochondrial [Selaginella moellendorffii]XP_024524020.1 ubiquinol oxidase 2, mitochondrial [Selaginella moellendorffii]|eukprot:XP_024524019.1 ubiquinol oxidase 2, mitochondrial [Selaginella moellendorffii]
MKKGVTGIFYAISEQQERSILLRHYSVAPALLRYFSSKGSASSTGETHTPPPSVKPSNSGSAGGDGTAKPVLSHYWGIVTKRPVREDGKAWPWNSFRPTDAYTPDVSIDLKKHHTPLSFVDKFAYWTVKAMRLPTDIFFQRRYGCRAMMLETVAAVPGMVGGMLLHCRSLRRFEHSGGWIKALLEEAENERMHLMTFMEVVQPKWYERALVFAVQGVFFNAYMVCYIAFPRLAHRIVGYLEEEAIHSYTEYIKEIDKGNIPNTPAPAIAIDYWRLPKDAKIRDVVQVVRADEAHHRDVNHFAADIHLKGKQLREAPAPLGYH